MDRLAVRGAAYALAQQLAAASATPYAFVQSVLRYLLARLHLQPEPAAQPATRSRASCSRTSSGYCQQFSGAMALLLRMGGRPGAGRRRLHVGHLEPRHRPVGRHRHRRPRLGRGVVPATTAGSASTRRPAVRPGPRRPDLAPIGEAPARRQGGSLPAPTSQATPAPDGRPRSRAPHGASVRHDVAADPAALAIAGRARRCWPRSSGLRPAGAGVPTTCSPSSSARWRAPDGRCRRGVTLAALEHRFRDSAARGGLHPRAAADAATAAAGRAPTARGAARCARSCGTVWV